MFKVPDDMLHLILMPKEKRTRTKNPQNKKPTKQETATEATT